jgi:hypothetical protein
MSGSGYNIKKFETANIFVSKNEFGRISHYFVVKNWFFFEIFDENKNTPIPPFFHKMSPSTPLQL